MPKPHRRLRTKTTCLAAPTVGQLALGVSAVAAVANAVIAGGVASQHQEDEQKWLGDLFSSEELAPEDPSKKKQVYLLTLPHPRNTDYVAPGSLTRQQLRAAVLDAFCNPVYTDVGNRAQQQRGKRKVERLVVFKECHAPDATGTTHVHYHVALQADESFKFAPYKRALATRHSLQSHWSCSHEGYWSAVRYGVMPTPKKEQAELDPEPLVWPASHPPLFEASQEENTAPALRRRRETAVKRAIGDGKKEPRACETDLYPIIVTQKFKNTPDDQWAAERLIEHIKKYSTPELFKFTWRIRKNLPAIIDDVWSWESIGDTLALVGQSRFDRLCAAAGEPCVCQGCWRQAAEWSLAANKVDAAEFCKHIATSLHHGRLENVPVLVCVGRFGGEGKSFLLAPLRKIFGAEHVQESPQPGNVPLLGLEKKRVVVLDEWGFGSSVVPLSLQLLWFQGKTFPVTRPQNTDYVGHLMYAGTAPVFVTSKEKDLMPIVQRAEAARAG